MKKQFLIVTALFAVMMLGACSEGESTENPLYQAIRNNASSVQHEDSAAYLQGTVPDSPARVMVQAALPMLQQVWANFDLDVETEEITVLEQTEDTAKVRIVTLTTKVAGEGPFRNNRVTAVETYKRYQGEWKLYDADASALQIDYLD